MSATITNTTRVHSATSFMNSLDSENIYFFAGKIDPWEDENEPEVAIATISEETMIKNSNVFMKKITGAGGFLGLKRYNWASGLVYTPWDDETDMNVVANWLGAQQPFYVFVTDATTGTISYNIYLCVGNKYDGPSTYTPSGQSTSIIEYLDGYKWKFMFNVSDDLLDYVNEAFVPCPHKETDKSSAQLAVEASTIPGSIDRIKILDQGDNYTSANTNIVITGDGTGAAAEVVLDEDGKIIECTIPNPGTGYSYAEITVAGDGIGAELKAVISPDQGHGYNASLQLNASFVLLKEIFNADESGLFSTINAYRRIGLMKNAKDTTGDPLDGDGYDLTSELVVENISGSFGYSNTIVGQTSGATGIIFDLDGTSFNITDIFGTFLVGETVKVKDVAENVATITEINNTEVDTKSSDIIYYENMQAVLRRTNQTETFILSIGY